MSSRVETRQRPDVAVEPALPGAPGPLTERQADEVTKVIRDLIRHESSLLHQRITWLLQIQGLLFTALGFAWRPSAGSGWDFGSLALVSLLAFLGITTAISIALAVVLYHPAVKRLQKWWADRLSPEQQHMRIVIGLDVPSWPVTRALRPWRALPVMFVLAWLAVLGIAFRR